MCTTVYLGRPTTEPSHAHGHHREKLQFTREVCSSCHTLIGRTCDLHRLLQNPRLPSILQGQSHGCQSRLTLGVICPPLSCGAARVHSVFFRSLFVSGAGPSCSISFRWRRNLRRMCASLLILCASTRRAGCGVRIRYLTRVRTGPSFG